MHAPRLQGFALLVTLFDEPLAERLAATALADVERKWTSLRHPERAAAWLRAHVVAAARRAVIRSVPDPGARADLVARLGADANVVAALATLSVVERASLVAHDVERLDKRDCATVVRRGPAAYGRLATRARRRYLQWWMTHPDVVSMRSPSGVAAQFVQVAASVVS